MSLEPVEGRRPPLSPSMALRVAVIGGVAFVIFGIVFFRLWYLQVLSGDQYLAQANDNRVRVVRDPAPRGAIVDRSGLTLVENKRATIIALEPEKLPAEIRSDAARWGQLAGRRERRPKGRKGPPVAIPRLTDPQVADLYRRLGHVLEISSDRIHERVIQQLAQVPYAAVRLKTDVLNTQRDYLLERASEFPGVKVETRYLRKYPHRNLAAQIFGTIGEISPDELEQDRFRGVTQGTVIGKEGLERSYDRYLRGRDGSTRILVNAQGDPKGESSGRPPTPGRSLRLTLDLGLQQTMQRALATAGRGLPSAAVALDPRNGEILGIASLPSFDPTELSRPITQARFEELYKDPDAAPAFNRAIGGTYPTGSTFKPITALAALDAQQITPGTIINDTGCIRVGRTAADERCNAKKTVYGPVDLREALKVSSDVYFYTMGLRLNPLEGEPLQKWASKLGVGRRSGIDLPGEFKGNVPDREWRDDINKAEAGCRKRTGRPCGIADGTNRPWTVGDEVNLSIGQGDLQATPLQMAIAYATIANGGRVVRPHLGLRVQDEEGRLIQKLAPRSARRIEIPDGWRQAIMDGLRDAASAPGGTSTDVFRGWNHERFPVFGKTGTAQRVGQLDQSWYVAYAHQATPEGKPLRPIVIAATVERGGFGAEAAAPAVRQMLSKWFLGAAGKFVAGNSETR